MKKKLLPVILVCCMLSAWLTAYAHADDIIASGNCGTTGNNGSDVQWTLDRSGNLTISGHGVVSSNAEWGRNPVLSVTINDGVTGIGARAFRNLNRLTQVTLPNSVFVIENEAFSGCSNLLSFTISDYVTSIGTSAFKNCDCLTEILIPNNVRSIGESAFEGCDVLQRVTILAIPIINTATFKNCPALRAITIPDSVTVIGQNAFSNCSALQDVYFTGSESLWNNITMTNGNVPLQSANVHFDTSLEATYRINSISISDLTGNPLTEIPNGVFLQTVSVTNRASGGTPVIFVAAYAADGQFLNYAYVTVKEPVGGTVEVTLPVDNSGGNVAQLKAFAVRSFGGLEPIGNLVTFPAQ